MCSILPWKWSKDQLPPEKQKCVASSQKTDRKIVKKAENSCLVLDEYERVNIKTNVIQRIVFSLIFRQISAISSITKNVWDF